MGHGRYGYVKVNLKLKFFLIGRFWKSGREVDDESDVLLKFKGNQVALLTNAEVVEEFIDFHDKAEGDIPIIINEEDKTYLVKSGEFLGVCQDCGEQSWLSVSEYLDGRGVPILSPVIIIGCAQCDKNFETTEDYLYKWKLK